MGFTFCFLYSPVKMCLFFLWLYTLHLSENSTHTTLPFWVFLLVFFDISIQLVKSLTSSPRLPPKQEQAEEISWLVRNVCTVDVLCVYFFYVIGEKNKLTFTNKADSYQ